MAGEIPSVTGQSSLESGARAEQASPIVPSLTPPPQTAPQCSKEGCPTLVDTEGSTLYHVTDSPRQRNKAQMKEQIKTPGKELRNKEMENLPDAEFKTLVIRMLTGMIELGCKKKEEMKSIQSEIKENIQGARREGEETGTQTKDLK